MKMNYDDEFINSDKVIIKQKKEIYHWSVNLIFLLDFIFYSFEKIFVNSF